LLLPGGRKKVTFSFEEKGIKLFREQVPKCLIRKYMG
jgi:hypothetical protein